MTNASEVDFFSDESLFDDPYPFFESLRTGKGPVWIEPVYGVAMVTGHDEELAVLRDHETFSSINAPSGPFSGFPAVEGDDASGLIESCRAQMPMHEFMVCMDPPQHDDYRSLLSRFFTPRRLKENEDFMWRLADDQMSLFVDTGRCEFSGEYSSPFAGLVIADLLGVPPEDMSRFRVWFEHQVRNIGTDSEITGDPLTFFQNSFERYIVERRATPRDDVLTSIATATFSDGSSPDVASIARESSFIFAAGQETTVRLLTFSMRYLAEHPHDQERLRSERNLIPNFVEEMLRLESPIKVHFRLARRTTTLGAITIPAGTTLALLNGAANRDPRRFESPDEVRIERPNAHEQLAFSRGVHSCLGQSLARAEARVTLERVLDRMGDIRVAEDAHGTMDARRWEYMPTWLFRGLMALHLEFTPIGA